MKTLKWQVQAVSIYDEDIAIRAPRQAGKTFTLAWIAALDAIIQRKNVLFTTHLMHTAQVALDETLAVVDHLGLTDQVKQVNRSNGNYRITMMDGTWIVFVSRNNANPRYAPDTLIFDEADLVDDDTFSAFLPTLCVSKRGRVIMAGIGVTSRWEEGSPFDRFCGLTKKKFDLSLGEVTGKDTTDPEVWKKANPLVGELISEDNIALMRKHMHTWDFAREVLGARLID